MENPSPVPAAATPPAVPAAAPTIAAPPPSTRRNWALPSWATSAFVHAVALTILLLVPMSDPPKAEEIIVEQETIELPSETEMIQDIQQPAEILPEPQALAAAEMTSEVKADASTSSNGGDDGGRMDAAENNGAITAVSAALDGGAANLPVGKGRTDGFSGRGAGKGVLLGKGGGTLNTEFAVKSGLDWMIKHQFPNGSWHIDYTPRSTGETQGKGEAKSDMAATSLALLPFLAANHTHQTGQHRGAVKKALYWILANQRADGRLGASQDQHEIYTHALGSIVLCETYALTKDRSVGAAAQKAIDFTCRSQNKLGGWRYGAKSTDADTSVFGWQFMALKSGMMGGLKVPEKTLTDAKRYLDSVKSGKSGGLFAYTSGEGPRPAMTAIGVLSLQYLGRNRADAAIEEGIQYLVKTAPPESTVQPYYWYYATQAVHHYQGTDWDRWNRSMRKIWVDKQNRDPKSTDFGSWNPADFNREQHDLKSGGRLYLTSIGLLTLEVYYRYLPLYDGVGKPDSSDMKTAKSE